MDSAIAESMNACN